MLIVNREYYEAIEKLRKEILNDLAKVMVVKESRSKNEQGTPEEPATEPS